MADTTPPVVTLNGANPQTTEAASPWVDPGATAMDVVSGAIVPVTISPQTGVRVTVLGNQYVSLISDIDDDIDDSLHQITYSATDPAGNTGSAVRTVTVVDTRPPVLNMAGSSPMQWEAATPYVVRGGGC